jgi:hypothetical protein
MRASLFRSLLELGMAAVRRRRKSAEGQIVKN